MDDDIPTVLNPFNFLEFRIYLSNNKDLKHIFYLDKFNEPSRVYYFYNSEESLKEIVDNINIYSINEELLFKNPQAIAVNQFIPKK